MDHVWQYINDYSQGTFEDLDIEFISGKYDGIRKCPSFDDCLAFSNSMNALVNSGYGRVTPQSRIYDKHLVDDIKFCVQLIDAIEQFGCNYYEITANVKSYNNCNYVVFDKFSIKESCIKSYDSVDEGLFNELIDYMCDNMIQCDWNYEIL